MTNLENYLSGFLNRTIRAVTFLSILALTVPAAAETVEVAPGVRVTKRTYAAPINELPFLGFAAKNSAQQAAGSEAPGRQLDAATSLADLAASPGNRLEALKGDRAGQFSIRINDQWRIWRGDRCIAASCRPSDFATNSELNRS
jgi:hypothetical protein